MKQKPTLSLWPVTGHRQTSQPVEKFLNKRVLSIEKKKQGVFTFYKEEMQWSQMSTNL